MRLLISLLELLYILRAIFNFLLDKFHTHLAPYDSLSPLSQRPATGQRNARRIAFLLLAFFILFGFILVLGKYIDNKPTTASTGLVTAHRMVTLNPSGWISEGIWWRGKQTPTPLPFTIQGAFFALFGYSIRGILCLHVLAGAMAGALLYRITARRFGAWTGLLAMVLYLAAPLPLYVTLSGWTFVWATMFLLLSVDLLDRSVQARNISYYLLAGLTLCCAGMSRPENYAVALIVILFLNIPLRYRAAFVALAFAYPIAQYLHNNVYLGDTAGLRILDDGRSAMSYPSLFQEWFGSLQRHILNRNFAPFLQWALLPAVLFFGVRRHRFLTAVLAYFCIALFAAYAMRRISFNHEGYYYAHVTLVMPFLAAFLAWLVDCLRAALRKIGLPPRAATASALFGLTALLVVNGFFLRHAYKDRLFFRVPESVREVRDYLHAHLRNEDRIALDYFREVSWMMAEIEGADGRDAYFYNSNTTGVPRPRLNAARKDITPEEQGQLNAWVRENYETWRNTAPPRFLVTQSDSAWLRERDRTHAMGHYRMFSLRPALSTDSADPLLPGTVVLENSEFMIIEADASEH
jgi:hypothetical protein